MDAAIAQRIGRLERENRIFRLVLGALTTGVLGFLILGQAGAPADRELTAQKLTIRDSDGRVRMILGPRQIDSGQTFGLNLFDPQGAPAAGLVYKSDTKGAWLGVSAENRTAELMAEPSRVWLEVQTPTGKCRLGDALPGPALLLTRNVAQLPEAELARMGEERRREQQLRDYRRSMALFAGFMDGKPFVTLFNSDGEPVWSTP